MASLKDISFTYDDLDDIWPLMLGDYPDITNAFYNGDYSKSLDQAQRDKHDWILQEINFAPGHRILDIGCGWGPMLRVIQERGGRGVGLTLSPRQAETCCHRGLEVRLLDWRDLDPAEIGQFDAILALGSMEHFCAYEEYLAGHQEQIYDRFFRLCQDLLVDGGRFYLQTMTWGKYVPWAGYDPTHAEIDQLVSLDAPPYSDGRILAYVGAMFPGSWLPKEEQLCRLSAPYFRLLKANDGRLDYIQTLTEWIKAWFRPFPGRRRAMLKLLPNYLRHHRAYQAKIKCIEENAVREVFIRNIFGHQRLFFEKR